jgi:hypothetical protein
MTAANSAYHPWRQLRVQGLEKHRESWQYEHGEHENRHDRHAGHNGRIDQRRRDLASRLLVTFNIFS